VKRVDAPAMRMQQASDFQAGQHLVDSCTAMRCISDADHRFQIISIDEALMQSEWYQQRFECLWQGFFNKT
jgi:hypothetical protein